MKNIEYRMILAIISVFFRDCEELYIIILKKLNHHYFKTVYFFFLWSLKKIFSIFHSNNIRKGKNNEIINISEIIRFFLRANTNFFEMSCINDILEF